MKTNNWRGEFDEELIEELGEIYSGENWNKPVIKIKKLIQSLLNKQKEEIAEKIKEPLENAFYECNLEPEDAENETESIINKIKEI